MNNIEKAQELLHSFKGNRYTYGKGALKQVGSLAGNVGKKAFFLFDTFPGSDKYIQIIKQELKEAGVVLTGEESGPKPNAPLEDLYRITDALKKSAADVIISFGGGSTIDALKSAEVLRTLGGEIEDYFGTGNVTKIKNEKEVELSPHIAIQTVASSGAHLTKYSNITNVKTGQKKLVVDEAIVPSLPVFDFSLTYNAPKGLTMDGALDGIAHNLEVLYGSVNASKYKLIEEVAKTGITLVVENLEKVIQDPHDEKARDALCIATDLGAYSIMLGGTNGGHLTSFSLVDILSHGRACAMMNPYYTVFFAPAVEKPLKMVGEIYKDAGLTDADLDSLSGRDLGIAVAEAMLSLSKKIDFPIKLSEVKGFTQAHIEKALNAAKNPQLKMKLQNMPIPLEPKLIEEFMRPILEAARDGDLSRIKNM
ncbi:MAG: iron-containing alcohol dehydrogenase [Spirochaetia bacterium]|nr:iron-containing alcohol dehydrogenase [Spirochaetia bacterium]MCF7945306.1 iron-containing alcohol dehydrogenase [Spirochaetia bacterium]MCF7946589.1 iron-containing alcohol dehydrogenase [Spirochaetia bacterium]